MYGQTATFSSWTLLLPALILYKNVVLFEYESVAFLLAVFEYDHGIFTCYGSRMNGADVLLVRLRDKSSARFKGERLRCREHSMLR